MSESALLLATAAIPIAALVIEDNGLPTALLGCTAVLLVGTRSIFHWQENYIRFSAAREAVENQRRRFYVGLPPYDDSSSRSKYLVAAVTEIEQTEMRAWFAIAVSRPRPSEDPKAGP